MALGDNDISTTAVGSEIGSSSHSIATLVGASGLNKYSRYAPGQLGVDGNKDVTLTPPGSNYKLGDFRRYDNSATTPGMQSPFTWSWGPGGTSGTLIFGYRVEAMNIKAFADPADYVTVNVYPTTLDRTNETNLLKTQTFAISWNAHTPLVGHTRQVTQVANAGPSGNIVSVANVPLNPGNSEIYVETFISDLAGNRKINFGVRANNYLDIPTHQFVMPDMHGWYSGNPTAAGYTAMFASCNPTSTPAPGSHITLALGTHYSFYLICEGIAGGQHRCVAISNADVLLYKNSVYAETLATGVTFNQNNGVAFVGDLVSHTFNYDDDITIRFANATTDGLTYTVI